MKLPFSLFLCLFHFMHEVEESESSKTEWEMFTSDKQLGDPALAAGLKYLRLILPLMSTGPCDPLHFHFILSLSLFLSVWAVFVCKRRVRERERENARREAERAKPSERQQATAARSDVSDLMKRNRIRERERERERERDMCAKSKGLYICVFLSLFLLKST